MLQVGITGVLALAPVLLVGTLLSEAQEKGRLPAALTGAVGDRIVDLIVGPLFTVLVLISVWAAGRFLDHRRFVDFGVHLSRRWWVDLGFGLALGAALLALVFVVEWAAGWIEITGVCEVRVPGLPLALALVYALVKDLCVGAYEELFSRGYQLKNAAEGLYGVCGMAETTAILLSAAGSSVLFGFLHVANPEATLLSTVALCLNGMFLALGYVLTGELAIPIGLHVAWNLSQGTLFGFPVSGDRENAAVIAVEQGGPAFMTGGAFGPEGGLLGISAMALGCLLIVTWVRLRYGRLGVHRRLAVPELVTERRAG